MKRLQRLQVLVRSSALVRRSADPEIPRYVISFLTLPDMLFIGPNDLAASMGYFAFDHAKIDEVQQATVKVLNAAKGAGKFAGHFALSADIGTFMASLEKFTAEVSANSISQLLKDPSKVLSL